MTVNRAGEREIRVTARCRCARLRGVDRSRRRRPFSAARVLSPINTPSQQAAPRKADHKQLGRWLMLAGGKDRARPRAQMESVPVDMRQRQLATRGDEPPRQRDASRPPASPSTPIKTLLNISASSSVCFRSTGRSRDRHHGTGCVVQDGRPVLSRRRRCRRRAGGAKRSQAHRRELTEGVGIDLERSAILHRYQDRASGRIRAGNGEDCEKVRTRRPRLPEPGAARQVRPASAGELGVSLEGDHGADAVVAVHRDRHRCDHRVAIDRDPGWMIDQMSQHAG